MKILTLAILASLLLAGCASDPPPAAPAASGREDTESFTIRAGEDLEYKLALEEGQKMSFDWKAAKPLDFDFHGDQEANPDDFTSYKTGTLASHASDFTAPFTGRHGWWWENNNPDAVTVTLHTKGTYGIVGITSGG